MAQVVLLRGVNVGGHRTFRPSVLARALADLDIVNIGAAGTFVVRAPISQVQLRSAIAAELPFEAEIMISPGRDVLRLAGTDHFAGHPPRPDLTRFASLLARTPRSAPVVPLALPEGGPWQLQVLARQGRWLVGIYRRQMQAIGHLGTLDDRFGVPVTTRNWTTVEKIVRLLREPR